MTDLPKKDRGRAWVLLSVLVVAYLLAAIDKSIISLLVEPIKHHFQLSDTDIGLLQGLGFLLIFSAAGVPAGYLIDRMPRMRIIAGAIFVWSTLTSACGLARQYWLLLFSRSGVALGEAVLNPASFSVIADTFAPRLQGLAFGIYIAAAPVGAGLSLMIGSVLIRLMDAQGAIDVPLLGHLEPWQMTLLVLGAPGAVFSVVAVWMREPPRRHLASSHGGGSRGQVGTFYRHNRRSLLFHHLAMSLTGIVLNGTLAWIPPFFSRVHGIGAGHIAGLGGAPLVLGGLGVLVGGALSDSSHALGPGARMRLCVGSSALAGIASLVFPLARSALVSAVALCTVYTFAGMTISAGTTALQRMIPGEIRGAVSSLYLLLYGICASSGPILVALANDHVFTSHGGIQYSLAVVCSVALVLATVFFALAVAPYAQSIKRIGEI